MARQEVKHPARRDTVKAPFSAGIVCDGWLFVSGQGPVDLATLEVRHGTMAEETRAALENVRLVLEAASCTFDDVVKSTCYISDMADFDEFSRTYREHFSRPRPVRTTAQAGLWGGMKVEIEVMARIPKSSHPFDNIELT
jgi:2-iminobutanoate/2-iminopropanoate deaminase